MRFIMYIFIFLGVTTCITPAYARLNVFTCEPEWKSLVDELGKEQLKSYAATTAYQDPHHIEARPSLIAKIRRADLVICSGADLEIGWLPVLMRQAGNDRILPGKPGYFAAASFIKRLEIPTSVDRSLGDMHALGNPHVHLDPRRITIIARALSARLIELDQANRPAYQKHADDFLQRWQTAIQKWQQQARPLQGMHVISHHKDWVYLFDWLGITLADTLEPKPGLPTTSGHLVELKNKIAQRSVAAIIHTPYQNPRAAQRLGQISSVPVIELPYTIGGDDKAQDLFGLFNVTIHKLLSVSK